MSVCFQNCCSLLNPDLTVAVLVLMSVEGAAVISEGDPQIFGFVVVWDCGLVVKMDWSGGEHSHVDTLAHVEFEVVLLGYVFHHVKGLLHGLWVVANQNGVICVGQVKQWCVLAVEGG